MPPRFSAYFTTRLLLSFSLALLVKGQTHHHRWHHFSHRKAHSLLLLDFCNFLDAIYDDAHTLLDAFNYLMILIYDDAATCQQHQLSGQHDVIDMRADDDFRVTCCASIEHFSLRNYFLASYIIYLMAFEFFTISKSRFLS